MSTSEAPKRIYLQPADEDTDEEVQRPAEQFEADGATWCEDRMNDFDVEYVRADIVAPLLALQDKIDRGEVVMVPATGVGPTWSCLGCGKVGVNLITHKSLGNDANDESPECLSCGSDEVYESPAEALRVAVDLLDKQRAGEAPTPAGGRPVCPGCETEFSGYCFSCESKDQAERGKPSGEAPRDPGTGAGEVSK